MRILQVEVNRPDFNALTRAAIIATASFLMLLGGCALVGYRMPQALKALMLAGMFWGSLSRQMGINPCTAGVTPS